MERRIRGSGLRYTLPYVINFAGLWLVVTIAAVLVAAISSYLYFSQRAAAAGGDPSNVGTAIIIQAVLSILAVVALAVFTTHRVAGPWIAVKRAMEAVRDGNLDYKLRMRGGDPRMEEVQEAFEQMLVKLRERAPAGRSESRSAAPAVETASRP